MAIAPALLVPTPTLTPPPVGGLLTVADIANAGDLHWQNGVEYVANPTPEATADAAVSCDPITAPTLAEGIGTVTDDPLRVHTGFTCKHPGLTKDEINQYARGKLAAGESAALERTVWPLIVDTADQPAGATPVSVLAGVGQLEAWLWESYGGTGVLHVSRSVIAYLAKAKQLVVSGGRLTTVLGTKISAGAYPGNGPATADPADGAMWIAATAAVQARRSEVRIRTEDGAGHFDPRTNKVIGLAERLYVVGWEDLSAAVQIRLEEVAVP